MINLRSDGDRHELLALVVAVPLTAIAGRILPTPLAIAFGAGYLFHAYWLSPDLDLPRCNSLRRWRSVGLAWWWVGYRQAVGCHRSVLSHGPFLGTFGRLVYLWPLWGAIALAFWSSPVLWASVGPWVAGGCCADLVHLWRDGLLFGGWKRPHTHNF